MKKSVQAVLINSNGQVLAVSRKHDHNDFGLVGGKMDPEDSTPENAIIRECKEETGLDIDKDSLQLIYVKHKDGRMGYTYLAKYSGEINYNEPHVVKWTNFEEIEAGCFGWWNTQVKESLISMGVKFLK